MSKVSPLAGKPAPNSILINVPKLVSAYYTQTPDFSQPSQKILFGTSGHRGCALNKGFNEAHILAMTQAICSYRQLNKITGPLFLGIDTHALSIPAFATALEVLAANEINVMIAEKEEYTPTPVISHAILEYNLSRVTGLADGIVITPSHDPPHHGGFKYNPPNGGPAEHKVTSWIEETANAFLENKLSGVKRISFERALRSSTTHLYDYITPYVNDLGEVIDMKVISSSKIHMGVDPLGGAGIHYWTRIAEFYHLDLTVVNPIIDPTFSFMTLDWDGQLRMDPSSFYAMGKLSELKTQFDIAFACDTDYDRHGIVAPSVGLLSANHYVCAAIFYLFQHRPHWNPNAAIGKTIVSSQMIDRIAKNLNRPIYEVPVGFKWFTDGLLSGSIEFAGEESAGATFSRINGKVWTTDKDGIILALLSAEMTARLGRDPGKIYQDLETSLGKTYYNRIDAPASLAQKKILKKLSSDQIQSTFLAGDKIEEIFSEAQGNHEAIGGIKVCTSMGWFAARPSGTEEMYRIYAESFKDDAHLKTILTEAQKIINNSFGSEI